MPTVNGKKYPYTKAGMKAARKAKRRRPLIKEGFAPIPYGSTK